MAIIATSDNRQSVPVNASNTLRQILQENNVNYRGANIMIDGTTFTNEDLDQPLSTLGGDDTSTIAVTVKIQNA